MFDRVAVERHIDAITQRQHAADAFRQHTQTGESHMSEDRRLLLSDLRATLAALDAATARGRELEDAVRDYLDDRNHAEFCAVNYRALCTCGLGRLQLALAPATGEENG